MNADLPPLKVWIHRRHLTQNDEANGYEPGYLFALQSYRGRALQFHVLLQSGAHFRHIPLHWLLHAPGGSECYDLERLQLWDCYSYNPVVSVLDFLRDYEVRAILKDKTEVPGKYYCTVDWLPDSDEKAGYVLQPDQNKCAHIVLLDNGQIAALPTNRLAFQDGFFIGNNSRPETKGYRTIETIWTAENSKRWSVADKDEVFY